VTSGVDDGRLSSVRSVKAAGTVVRVAVPEDAGAIAAIGRAAFPDLHKDVLDESTIGLVVEQTYSLASLRACIDLSARSDGAHFLVAERAGSIVGYLHYDRVGSEPQLHRIYVDPDQKRSGVGSVLIRELHARLSAGESYILMVFAANDAAIEFYRRHGLEEQARVDAIAFAREHAGVDFPPDTPALPALVMRFTSTTG
jgi:ribosomal protein S18 acetylase RimI-like enzyme